MNLANAREYYGKVLTGSADLLTDACATAEAPPSMIRAALANVHPGVTARYYGCGLIAPEALQGTRILDLGSGSGQDAYVLAQLVGPEGFVVGVDATREQLEVANGHREWHRKRFGFVRSNVAFLEGDIEALDALDLGEGRFDVIVSNCVINLVADKARVFAAAHRLLNPGGELYFSDIYADRRIPEALRADPVLHGECLAGALYWGDFLALASAAGFVDPRLVSDRPVALRHPKLSESLDGIRFFSATWRLFKLDGLELQCEDYGQAVVYKGTIPGSEALFRLDKRHAIEAGRIFPVCGNTWRMLAETRFAPHFDFVGDFSRHFGLFSGCGSAIPFNEAKPQPVRADGPCC